MEARIRRWGNSLALRIPGPIAAELGLGDGALVDLRLVDGRLVVVPQREGPHFRLEELLAQVTADNLHAEVETGPAVGREVW